MDSEIYVFFCFCFCFFFVRSSESFRDIEKSQKAKVKIISLFQISLLSYLISSTALFTAEK